MRNLLSRSALGFVQATLAVLLVGSSLAAAMWVVGYNGFQVVETAELPLRLGEGPWNALPYEPVHVRGPAGVATAAAGNRAISWTGEVEVRAGDGTSEFFGSEANLSFLGLTTLQRLAWSGVRIAPVIGLAFLWWLLFWIVGRVRRGHGFERAVSTRITLIGLLVTIGAPAIEVLRWQVARWLIETSTASDIAAPADTHFGLAPVAIGLAILVVGYAWREAIRMREDLDGLV
jgi:hypothetical protein